MRLAPAAPIGCVREGSGTLKGTPEPAGVRRQEDSVEVDRVVVVKAVVVLRARVSAHTWLT